MQRGPRLLALRLWRLGAATTAGAGGGSGQGGHGSGSLGFFLGASGAARASDPGGRGKSQFCKSLATNLHDVRDPSLPSTRTQILRCKADNTDISHRVNLTLDTQRGRSVPWWVPRHAYHHIDTGLVSRLHHARRRYHASVWCVSCYLVFVEIAGDTHTHTHTHTRAAKVLRPSAASSHNLMHASPITKDYV
jgi:hypothetical protein